MRNSTKSTEFVKGKLPTCKKLMISIRRKSDKSVRIVTGLSIDHILQELAKKQDYDFSPKRNSDENVNGAENIVLSSSSSDNVNGLKICSTFSPLLGKNNYEITKIQPSVGFNNHGTQSGFLKQSFIAYEANSAFKVSKISNVKNKKTESECPPESDIDSCQNQMEKKKCEVSQFSEQNEFSDGVQEPLVVNEVAEEPNSRICVIEKVFGNANTTFSSSDDTTLCNNEGVCLDTQESQLIVPKKTDDITKIKGWRRKQFFVEKPTVIEFQQISYNNNSVCLSSTTDSASSEPEDISSNNSAENAFVCESLDEFLEQDAELKINYEVPHLFAEVGIKLTKEEIASTPSLSENDIKEVETKYCRSVPDQNDIIILDDVKTEKVKRVKRQSPENGEESVKLLKLENNTRLVKNVKKLNSKETNCCNKNPKTIEGESKENNLNEMKLGVTDLNRTDNVSHVKLTSKVVGLVVYPSPHTPLHPIVQFHLRKLRSYQTTIDSNWANFAASVVVNKDAKYERRIVPVKCCVKVLSDPETSKENIKNVTPTVAEGVTEVAPTPVKEAKSTETSNEDKCSGKSSVKMFSEEELKRMKNCRVVIKKLDRKPGSKPWCMKHNRFNCKNCTIKNFTSILKPLSRKEIQENVNSKPKEPEEPVPMSSESGSYEGVVNLLAKKLKLFHPDSLTSIDSLKTLNLNAVELIKLKFIQKSFWHKYISIWFLRSEKTNVRSRAFLTFTKTPPVPKAINLRCGVAVDNLPKVIREIVYAEKCVDPNEYLLLYCNGDYWEIHGSVNVAFNRTIRNTEQVLIPPDLPELISLQNISFKLLKVKAVKWWVLDLAQQFQVIELKSENLMASISHEQLREFIKRYSAGFMPIRTNLGGRVFGAYMIQSLLPYVLIGPYHLFEIRNMTLRKEFATLPFTYSEVKDSNDSNFLKFHISSAIKETKKSGKSVEGLWLHCRIFTDHSCFLEVMTGYGVNAVPRSSYSINDEHGYSLSSSLLPDPNSKSDDSSRGNLQVQVYLYFDIFGLGYVLGVLEEDNSVTIRHPLNEQTKVNSAEIGTWFLGILRRKVRFVPKNLIVNWFITKNKAHLKNRQPFNKNFLNGAHILTDSGVFYVLKLAESSNQNSSVPKSSIIEAAGKSSVIEEVVYLKILSDMLVKKSEVKPKMDKVLTEAVKEINRLKKKLNILERVKACFEEEKLGLFSSYLMTIHLKGLNKKLSVLLLKQIEKLFFSENGKIDETYMKKLKLYSFGRLYLKTIEKERLIKFDSMTSLNNLGE